MHPVSSQKLTKHMHSAQICGLSNDFVIFRAEVTSNYYSLERLGITVGSLHSLRLV